MGGEFQILLGKIQPYPGKLPGKKQTKFQSLVGKINYIRMPCEPQSLTMVQSLIGKMNDGKGIDDFILNRFQLLIGDIQIPLYQSRIWVKSFFISTF